jgi:hypothetical protein
MISTTRAFIFIHVPKSAGNSIQDVLLPYSDDAKTCTGHQDGVERFGIAGQMTDKKHASLADYERKLGARLADYFKFCVVRNPWERAISNYLSPHRWMEKRGGTYVAVPPVWDEGRFLGLLARMLPAAAYVKDMNGEIRVDQVIRFENLEADFRAIRQILNIPGPPLQHRNRAAPEFDRGVVYRSPKLVAAVASAMAEDIARWHYTPDGT